MINGKNLKLNRILNKKAIIGFSFLFVFIFAVINTKAATPSLISYKSRLRNASGTPVTTATTIQFSLYSNPSTGSPSDTPSANGPLLWTESYNGSSCSQVIPDSNGYLYVSLGSCTNFPSYLDFNSSSIYLGVKIGTDAEASPRVQFTSSPFALNSERVNGIKANATATANQLLALDSDLNFNIASGTFIGNNLRLNSLIGSSTQCLSADINGNIVGTGNPCGYIASLLLSATNTLISSINGVTTTTSIINSNTASSSGNVFQTIVNGVISNVVNIINSFSQSVSGNVLTTNINGEIATTTLISSNSIDYAGGILTSNVNGVISTTSITGLLPTTTNSLSSNTNLLTSIVNGVISTSSIINSNTASSSGNIFESIVNGISSTSTIINTNVASSSGNVFQTIVNGVISNVSNIINSFSQTLSGNTLTTVINGITSSTSVISSNSISTSGSNIISSVNGVTSTISILNAVASSTSNSLDYAGGILTSNVNGIVSTTSIIGLLPTTTNSISSSGNIITSIVNGLSTSTTIINSNIASTTGNYFENIINGISSGVKKFINSFSQSVSGNVLTTNINGEIATTSVINTNVASSSGNVFQTIVNGVSSSIANIINSNVLSVSTSTNSVVITSNINGTSSSATFNTVDSAQIVSSTNTLQIFVNGVSSAIANIINSFSQSVSGNVLTTNINGEIATTTLISSNSIDYAGGIITSNVNGKVATTSIIGLLPTTTNSLSSNTNTLTSVVNGVTSSASIINSNNISFSSSTNTLNFSVNGFLATTSIDVYNKYLPLTGGTLTGDLFGTNATFSGSVFLPNTVVINSQRGGALQGSLNIHSVNSSNPTLVTLTRPNNPSAAGFSFYVDTDDHTYFNTTNADYIWKVSDTERMRLTSAGNFGININNPSEKLEVNGNVKSNRFITTGGSSSQLVTGDGTLINTSTFQSSGSYESPLSFTSPLSRSVNTISILQSSSSTNGYLSSTDWNTFNNKLNNTSVAGTTNYISKFTSSNSIGNSLIYDNGTSIGIGTNNPGSSYKLDLNGNLAVSGNIRQVTNASDGSGLTVSAPNNNNDPQIQLSRLNSDTFNFRIRGASGSSWLSIWDNTNGNVDKGLVIKGDKIGIGTASISDTLTVAGTPTSISGGSNDAYLTYGSNNGGLYIYGSQGPNNIFRVEDSGYVRISDANSGNELFSFDTDGGFYNRDSNGIDKFSIDSRGVISNLGVVNGTSYEKFYSGQNGEFGFNAINSNGSTYSNYPLLQVDGSGEVFFTGIVDGLTSNIFSSQTVYIGRSGDFSITGKQDFGNGWNANSTFNIDNVGTFYNYGVVSDAGGDPFQFSKIYSSQDGDFIISSVKDFGNGINGSNDVFHIETNGTTHFYGITNNGSGNPLQTENVRITSSGNVGIGTTTPTQKLSVIGNIFASSFIKQGGTSTQFLKADGSVDSNTYLTSSTGVSSFNTRTGAITLNNTDVTTALGYTPYNSSNPSNYISLSSLSATSPLLYNNSTGAFSISQSSSSTNGYLSSTDWNTFNNKQANLVSGTNIKTINGSSLLGSGNLVIAGGSATSSWGSIGTGTGVASQTDLVDYLSNNYFPLSRFIATEDNGILYKDINGDITNSGDFVWNGSVNTLKINGFISDISDIVAIDINNRTLKYDSSDVASWGTSDGVPQFNIYGDLNLPITGSILGTNIDGKVQPIFVAGSLNWDGTTLSYYAPTISVSTNEIAYGGAGGLASSANFTRDTNGVVNITGTSQTGSNANGILNLAQTWNTTGNPTAFKLNITNTASGATSKLMDLQVGGSSKFVVDKSGNVGIGTTTPSYKLDVKSSLTGAVVDNVGRFSSDADYVAFTVNANKSDGTGQTDILFQKKGIQTWNMGSDFATNGTKDFFVYDATNSNNPLYVANNGDIRLGSTGGTNTGGYWNTQRMTILANSGNVGIGTTNPSSAVDVSRSASDAILSLTTTGNYNPGLIFTRNSGTSKYRFSSYYSDASGALTYQSYNTRFNVSTWTLDNSAKDGMVTLIGNYTGLGNTAAYMINGQAAGAGALTGITSFSSVDFSARFGNFTDAEQATSFGAQIYVRPRLTTTNGIAIKSIASYTGNYIDIQDSSSVSKFVVNSGGNVTANSFIKSGGTSTQFLKADGSVDSNTYLTSAVMSGYLPLTGGTLTGNVTSKMITSITSSGSVGGNFTLWKDSTPTKGFALGFNNNSGVSTNNLNISRYDGSAWYNALSIDSSTGNLSLNTIPTGSSGNNILVSNSGTISYRTPAEILSDIGGITATGNTTIGSQNYLASTTIKFGDAGYVGLASSIFTSGGMFSSDLGINSISGNIVFGQGTSPKMFYDGTNNRLGINAATPAYSIDVQGGDINTTGVYRISAAKALSTSGTTFILGNNDPYSLSFAAGGTAGSSRMYIDYNTGNVGINTTGALSKFDVAGNVAIGSYAGSSAAPSNGLIVSGNVGIGTNNPTHQLEVSGTSNFSGLLSGTSATFSGNITTTAPANTSGFIVKNYAANNILNFYADSGNSGVLQINSITGANNIALYGSSGNANFAGDITTSGIHVNGTESNDILSQSYANSAITTNPPHINSSLRNSLKFNWYSTDWEIGNIRGGGTDTEGFGITTNNGTNLRWRVTNGTTYDYNNLIVSGNVVSNKFITTGGSSSQLVTGDGTLINTSTFQTAGDYVLAIHGIDTPMTQTGDWTAMTTTSGISGWTHVLNMNWGANDQNNWVSQIAVNAQNDSGMYYRSISNPNSPISNKVWRRVLDDNNYGSYALPLTGGTLSGNLNINKTGDSLYIGEIGANARQLILGMSTSTTHGYGQIQAVHQGVVYTNLVLNKDGGNVGIGTTTPAYKLDVNGAIHTNNYIFAGGAVYGQGGTTGSAFLGNGGTGTGDESGLYEDYNGEVIANADFADSQYYFAARDISVGMGPSGIINFAKNITLSNTNPYINFSNISSSTGYGIRSNAGVMQFKNNGGSWTSFNNASVAGSNGYVQFNNGGNFGGDSELFWNNSGKKLGIGTNTPNIFKLEVAGDIGPTADATYNVGSADLRYSNGFFVNVNATNYHTGFNPGSVLFADSTGIISGNSSNFYWDNTMNRLGIGTNTPGARLDVNGSARIKGIFSVENDSTNSTVVTAYGGLNDERFVLSNHLGNDMLTMYGNNGYSILTLGNKNGNVFLDTYGYASSSYFNLYNPSTGYNSLSMVTDLTGNGFSLYDQNGDAMLVMNSGSNSNQFILSSQSSTNFFKITSFASSSEIDFRTPTTNEQILNIAGSPTTTRFYMYDPNGASFFTLDSDLNNSNFEMSSPTTGPFVSFKSDTTNNPSFIGDEYNQQNIRLGIGNSNPQFTLHVGSGNYQISGGVVARFENSAGGSSYCDIAPGYGGFYCSSDRRLKKNINTIDIGVLDKIISLNSVTYNWNPENNSDPVHAGFIAQEIEQIFPDLVNTDTKTGLKSVSYMGLTPYIVKGIQELNRKVIDINSSSSALLFANVGSSTLINNTIQNSLNNLSLFLASTTDMNIASTTLANLNDLFSTSSLASIKALTNSLTLNNFDLNLNGNALVNVKAIESASKNWKVGEDGIIYAKEIRAERYCNADGSKCIDINNFNGSTVSNNSVNNGNINSGSTDNSSSTQDTNNNGSGDSIVVNTDTNTTSSDTSSNNSSTDTTTSSGDTTANNSAGDSTVTASTDSGTPTS